MLPGRRRLHRMATDEPIEDETVEDLPDPDSREGAQPEDTLEGNADDVETGESKGEDAGSADEALDELEAEELEMLTEDETSETLVVDEAAEMRAIRRAELSMDQQGVVEASDGEFVCSSCFLVLKTSQLANSRKKTCRDCSA